MTEPVYKVMTRADWEAFDRSGEYQGSEADRRDGFIHLAAADQLSSVCRRHFADRHDLILLALDPDKFGQQIRWEEAHDRHYPHLYGPLPSHAVLGADPIPDDPDQRQLMLALSCT